MAPKTVLTIDALDDQAALELPERELMNCGCGSLLGLGANVGVGAAASVSGLNVQAGLAANTSGGLNIGTGAVITAGTSGCS